MNLVPATSVDRDSLCLLMDSTDGSGFKKRRQIEKVWKAYKAGKLYIPHNETERQKWWRCEARFMLGEYGDWSGWEYRDDWAATLWHTAPYSVGPWKGGETDCLYVIGEQGIGDEIFFASCMNETHRAKRVIVECMPRLQSIFERSFGVETRPAVIKDGVRHKQELPEGVTAWISLADIPRRFRRDLGDFPGVPYITACPEQVRKYRDYRGLTGVSWRGAQGEIPELMKTGYLSLQYDQAWDEELERPEVDLRNDIEGVLGLLANLEKVVTVSTSVAHFAAALGKEVHTVIAPVKSASRANIFPFKWICKKTPGRTPWYGSASVYKNWNDYERRSAVTGIRPAEV